MRSLNKQTFAGLKLGLRTKLALLALALLALPWAGYQHLKGMESHLRAGQEENLLNTARAASQLLNDRKDLFPSDTNGQHSLTAYALPAQIRLDGYASDWGRYQDRLEDLPSPKPNTHAQVVFGAYKDAAYVLLKMRDANPVYVQNPANPLQSDHVTLDVIGKAGNRQRYLFATAAPGWLQGRLILDRPDESPLFWPEARMPAQWTAVDGGWNLEFSLPRSFVQHGLNLEIHSSAPVQSNAQTNAKQKTKEESMHAVEAESAARFSQTKKRKSLGSPPSPALDMPAHSAHSTNTADTEMDVFGVPMRSARTDTVQKPPPKPLTPVLLPSTRITELLTKLDQEGTRIWVVDPQRRVLGVTGSPQDLDADHTQDESLTEKLLTEAYALLFLSGREFADPREAADRLDGPEVEQALKGKAKVQRRDTSDADVHLLTAAVPVFDGSRVHGAVLVEQTTASIVTLQNQAITELIQLSLTVLAGATGLFLLFASRLSGRIRQLRNAARNAIEPDGRVNQTAIPGLSSSDEIGDLARDMDAMLERQRQYTRYLESMAGKLAHELRTPIAVVRSSLDNLDAEGMPENSRVYGQRAREGIERLTAILNRMSEARRLEQSIDQVDRESFDLNQVLNDCIGGYRDVYAPREIRYTGPDKAVPFEGAPELIVQALDKLLDNANDFALIDTALEVTLTQGDKNWSISVTNKGPALPESMADGLFESMVSVRDASADIGPTPHLGLGLYIVRLVADYHRGLARAENLAGDRVRFSLLLRG